MAQESRTRFERIGKGGQELNRTFGGIGINAMMTGLLWLVMALLVEHLWQLETRRAQEDRRAELMVETAAARARLESELNATLYLTSGLVGYVTAYDDLLEPQRVETALEVIHRTGRHVRNVALAPDNVIRFIYPLEGNRDALGVAYADLPQQWPDVRRAIDERRTVLAGPLDLVQGGHGLVVRTPVFLGDGRYWGVLSLVIDSDSLFRAAGLTEVDGVDFVISSRIDGHSGEADESVIFGDPGMLSIRGRPLEIAVPGGSWLIAAQDHSVGRATSRALDAYRVGGHLVVLVIAILVFALLTERDRIRFLALHDPLTRLPNRRQFKRRMNRLLQSASSRSVTLLYIDLNGFKAVNDQYGHGRGDEVLAMIAQRMKPLLHRGEMLARIGGDEFAVVLPEDAQGQRSRQLAEAIRGAIQKPYPGIELPEPLDAAIGVAVSPDDGTDPLTLLHAADERMYDHKGRNRPASRTS